MAVFDTFSYRQRVANGEMPDTFVYNKLPEGLRNQIIHIWEDAIGLYIGSRRRRGLDGNSVGWQKIHDIVARAHGLRALPGSLNDYDPYDHCITYLHTAPVNKALDLIEVSFHYIDTTMRACGPHALFSMGINADPDDAIEELNEYFRRAGVGYWFEGGKIIRIDSELIHSEIVRPALRYLHQQGFEGPREEFMKAHAHYRAGEMKDAITNANNAFESTLKTICDQRRWEYQQGVGSISKALGVSARRRGI